MSYCEVHSMIMFGNDDQQTHFKPIMWHVKWIAAAKINVKCVGFNKDIQHPIKIFVRLFKNDGNNRKNHSNDIKESTQ